MADVTTKCKGCGRVYVGSKAAGKAWHLTHTCKK